MPDRDVISVYAIIVRDDADNPSDLSNIVSAKLVYVPPEEPKSSNLAAIIGGSVGGAVALIIILALIALYYKGVIGSKSTSSQSKGVVQHSNKGYMA